jgi:hypothetical protein
MCRLTHRYRQQAGSYRGLVHRSDMSERSREGQRAHPKSQVGYQAASAVVAVSAPSRPEPVRQPVTTSIGASINVDPRRVKACK